MKKCYLLQSFLCLLVVSCSINEMDTKDAFNTSDEIFYASLESYSEPDTKVYVDENVKILWDEDDRITIFNRYTYNQEYRFLGETGDNAGAFKKVPNDDFVTGNSLDHIYAIYPFLETTKISNKEVMTVTLPAEQVYREGSFGPGANVMTSATDDNNLMFKNVGGYLVLKFYGEGVSVSSIKLEGNNGELLSGKASVTQAVGGNPTAKMATTAGTSVTLFCDTPVELGATKEEATQFWLVVPPTAFASGFTLTVTDAYGAVFVKETTKNLSIARNGVLRISPIEVLLSKPQPNNVIYYTSTDGEIVTPYATDVFGASIVSNEYKNEQGIITFDGDVTSIGYDAFYMCSSLTSIKLPESVTSIGVAAFSNCTSLSSVSIPSTVTSIGQIAFMNCSSLIDIVFPESLVEIGMSAFIRCSSLSTITLPESVTNLGDKAFAGCVSLSSFSGKYSADNGRCLIRDNIIIAIAPYGLTSYSIPYGVTGIEHAFLECNLSSITIPKTVKTIGEDAFHGCKNLSSIIIPDSVTSIGYQAFTGSGLVSIIIPSSVKTIDGCAFEISRNLEFVTIEEGVTSIGDSAFKNCYSLSSIILPESVSLIKGNAFYNCTSLSSITVKAINPPTFYSGNTSAFSNTICPIYVPSESVEVYKSATGWIAYSDRIQAIPTSSTTGEINGHAYVDMGNGLKWARMNVGANSQVDYGDYFAWGETEPYYNSLSPLTWKVDKSSGYSWTSYQYNPSGDGVSFTRYTGSDEDILLSEDDAASYNWGGSWRTPTYSDWNWLYLNCTWQWESINQVYGYRVTSSINGNIIFLPAAGYGLMRMVDLYSYIGFYWSSSMVNVDDTPVARGLRLTSSQASFLDDYRIRGQSIRPVSD